MSGSFSASGSRLSQPGGLGKFVLGLAPIPLIFGLGLIFFDGKNVLGWLLSLVGLVVIVTGVVANLHVYFQTTSLYNLLIMLVLIAAGLGLMARSLRAH